MRAVIQRVSEAAVRVEGEIVGRIGRGLLVLLGVARTDGEQEANFLSEKIVHLRVFEDEQGKLNRSVLDVGGELLVVSQFTLLADCRKGRRPSFIEAADAERDQELAEPSLLHVPRPQRLPDHDALPRGFFPRRVFRHPSRGRARHL